LKLNFNLSYSRVSNKDKALIARQLATMLGSGLSVDQAFKILNVQVKNKTLSNAFNAIINDLEQGNSLSFALNRQKRIFDPVFVAIVRSGENSGKLDKVLDQLAIRLELADDFNSKIKGAMYYPGFVLFTMFVIIILMMVFIVPQLKTVFEDSNIPLPTITAFIIWLSDFTRHWGWIELIVVILLAIGGYIFIKSREGGSTWDRVKINLPIFRELYILIYMTRFCQTMSMLIQAGLPIMETLAISADVIQNRVYTESLKNVVSQVERGIPISVPLSKDPNFPIMVSQMILVGEQTGKMSQVLSKLAEYYEKESDAKIKTVSSLIEPALIVFIGIGVGFLVFSIIYPIYSIAQTGL